MTLAAVLLIIVSAVVHACWNLLGKRENPSPKFFLMANTFGCVFLAPVLFTHMDLLDRFSGRVWLFLLVTGLFQAIYYNGLAGAYRTGHLSVAYPLARSTPVVMVALINVAMGKSGQLSGPAILGMGLITLGGLTLPVVRLSEWKPKDYLCASSLFAMMAAVGTSGYSIVDDAALRILARSSVHPDKTMLTLVYALFESQSSSFWLLFFVLLDRKKDVAPAKSMKYRIGSAAAAGFAIYLAYSLVLLAMTYAHNVSYIVAFRQLSIPLGALFGVTLLGEPRYPAKFIGIGIMLAGLVLVAVS